MDRVLFSSEIEDLNIELVTAADVVRLSFIVQPSISYLDLQLCGNSPILDYFESLSDSKRHLRSYVNTRERCRKLFIPSRRSLYTLHLDLDQESYKDFITNLASFFSSNLDVPQIIFINLLPVEILDNLLQAAIDMKVPKIKMLKMITENHSSKQPLLSWLPIENAAQFIQCFYPRIPDSKIFKDFIRRFNIVKWMVAEECPEKLEYLLYCARMNGNERLDSPHSKPEHLVSLNIRAENLKNVRPTLKYVYTTATFKKFHLSRITLRRPRLTETYVKNVHKCMATNRVRRALQTIRIYLVSLQDGNSETAAEALGLVWNSISEPYVTCRELEKGFGGALLEGEVDLVHDFYKQAVGESCENHQPRSLKHLCRTFLRRTIWINKLWIPEGIQRLPLPKSLQLYLNLDQPLSIPGTPLSL